MKQAGQRLGGGLDGPCFGPHGRFTTEQGATFTSQAYLESAQAAIDAAHL